MHWYLWKVKCYSKQTITAKKMKWTYQKLKFIVDACNTLKINWWPIFHKRIFFISSKPYPTLKLPSNLYDCENREFIVDACNTMKFNWCPFFHKRIFFISSKPYPTLKLPPNLYDCENRELYYYNFFTFIMMWWVVIILNITILSIFFFSYSN